MEEEDPEEDPSKEEEDLEEDPSEGEQEEDPKEDSVEERVGLTEEENLVRRLEGFEDEGMDYEEKRGESWTGVTSWRRGKYGRMCRGECPLDAPASRV